jgi:alkanesulfonate monooxygenase SsuD/methylene tetrahydromethanopterin reductase-like flavin-dependent oxidoreductase (luciferase family)
MDLKGYPIDGPMPQDVVQQVGGTAGGRSIQEMAWREGLTIRQTYERILGSQAGNVMKGDASHIADIMEDWYKGKACDGFILQIPIMPRMLKNFVDLVVPELQRRGLFRREYEGTTLRDNLRLKRPADPFKGRK